MSREIKFRAWSEEKKVMYFHEECFKLGFYPTYIKKTRPLIWLQFTGLLDRNGKEIFEGDILIDDDSEPMRHRIVWVEDEAKFELETLADDEGNWESYLIDSLAELGRVNLTKGFEIIGNIYENPELLTPTNK